VSAFINNWECHLTAIYVYEDGAIDCWEMLDRALFREKLRERWVVPAPKRNQMLSIADFGRPQMAEESWVQSTETISAEVDAIIHLLNPQMTGLIDMEGRDHDLRGSIRVAKIDAIPGQPYRLNEATGEEVLGDTIQILHHPRDGIWEFKKLFIFADGLLRIGPEGALFPLVELPSLYAAGIIAGHAPAGAKIALPGLGEFRVANALSEIFTDISIADRFHQVRDVVEMLNGARGVVRSCILAFEKFERESSAENREMLRAAYEAVPSQLRMYCGDMDSHDWPIRRALYGAESGTR
jgi:hypothetical protein